MRNLLRRLLVPLLIIPMVLSGGAFPVAAEDSATSAGRVSGSQVTLSYDANITGQVTGSTASVTQDAGTEFTVAENGFTVNGFRFKDWSTGKNSNIDSETRYRPEAKITLYENTTLYAQWEAQDVTVYTDGVKGEEIFADQVFITDENVPASFNPDSNKAKVDDKGNPVRTGYTFTGWKYGSANDIDDSETLEALRTQAGHSGIVHVAQWKRNQDTEVTYTLSYDANGGTGAPDTETVTEAEDSHSFKISDKEPTREGYTFLGWVEDPENIYGTRYQAGDQITLTMANSKKALYAAWEKEGLYIRILHYDDNGGQGGPSIDRYNGTDKEHTFTISSTEPTKEGYTFLGWADSKDATTPKYKAAAETGITNSITLTEDNWDKTIYAVWKENEKKSTPKETQDPAVTPGRSDRRGPERPSNRPGRDNGRRSARTGKNSTSSSIRFADVPYGSYYYTPVYWAVNRSITSGTDSTHFSPDDPCSRAQMATFLYRLTGSPSVSGKMPFTDVKAGSYYYKAVLWAAQNGITSGTTATTFEPDQNCTRGQTATFLYRLKGRPAVNDAKAFNDVNGKAYYATAVNWAYQSGVATGKRTGVYAPDENCTRGQMVTFLYRYDKAK